MVDWQRRQAIYLAVARHPGAAPIQRHAGADLSPAAVNFINPGCFGDFFFRMRKAQG